METTITSLTDGSLWGITCHLGDDEHMATWQLSTVDLGRPANSPANGFIRGQRRMALRDTLILTWAKRMCYVFCFIKICSKKLKN